MGPYIVNIGNSTLLRVILFIQTRLFKKIKQLFFLVTLPLDPRRVVASFFLKGEASPLFQNSQGGISPLRILPKHTLKTTPKKKRFRLRREQAKKSPRRRRVGQNMVPQWVAIQWGQIWSTSGNRGMPQAQRRKAKEQEQKQKGDGWALSHPANGLLATGLYDTVFYCIQLGII